MTTYLQLKEQAEKMLAEAEALRRKEFADQVAGMIATLKEHGITLADLQAHGFGRAGRAGKRTVKNAGVPKYRDPKTGATWTGRGRVPQWMVDLEAVGQNRAHFLI